MHRKGIRMKSKRQLKIIELVNKYDIETQEDLADRLTQAGFSVTQATISRDIRELKLSKVTFHGGRQKYAVLNSPDTEMADKFSRVLKEGYLSSAVATNLVVLKMCIRDRVKNAIETMTGLEVSEVNIRIAGVNLEDNK